MSTGKMKNGLAFLAIAIISSVITLLGYHLISNQHNYISLRQHLLPGVAAEDIRVHAAAFNQREDNVVLASVTQVGGFPDFTEVAARSVDAVVHIRTTTTMQQQRAMDPLEFFFGIPQQPQQQPQLQQPRPLGSGSGVIISADGYVITNNHVIDRAYEVMVTLNDSREFTARVVGRDPATDIALLKIEEQNLPHLTFGNSDDLRVGEWILAVGNPFNLTSTVTAGIVSATNRGNVMPTRGRENINSIESFIQIDAAVNHGNSGGALVNMRGELVGINTVIFSRTGDFAGLAFAVPISIAGRVAADLREFGVFQRAMLGVTFEGALPNSERARELAQINGVVVYSFSDRSASRAAGMEVGDIITAINGVPTNNFPEVQMQLSRFRPGDRVVVTVQRGNSTHHLNVELTNAEGTTEIIQAQAEAPATPQAINAMQALGASFRAIPAERQRQLGISSGVEVTNVTRQGLFRREGINNGFIVMRINNTPVNSEADVAQVVGEAVNNPQDQVIMVTGFHPNGRTQNIAIDLGRE